jgi:hypothetical protein
MGYVGFLNLVLGRRPCLLLYPSLLVVGVHLDHGLICVMPAVPVAAAVISTIPIPSVIVPRSIPLPPILVPWPIPSIIPLPIPSR